jgi:predicted transcriptional regulator
VKHAAKDAIDEFCDPSAPMVQPEDWEVIYLNSGDIRKRRLDLLPKNDGKPADTKSLSPKLAVDMPDHIVHYSLQEILDRQALVRLTPSIASLSKLFQEERDCTQQLREDLRQTNENHERLSEELQKLRTDSGRLRAQLQQTEKESRQLHTKLQEAEDESRRHCEEARRNREEARRSREEARRSREEAQGYQEEAQKIRQELLQEQNHRLRDEVAQLRSKQSKESKESHEYDTQPIQLHQQCSMF